MARDLTRHDFAAPDGLAEALASRVAAELVAAIDQRGIATLAVSGGATPALFLTRLGDRILPWDRVTVTLVDERLAPPSSPRSNEGLVRRTLLAGKAGAAAFVPLMSEGQGATEAAKAADAAVSALPLPLDAVILGMGGDGHTASFFPDAATLTALLDPGQTRAAMDVEAPSAGEPRLTLTLPIVAQARFLALHIEGDGKRATLERALAADGPRLPIRAVLDAAATTPHIFWAPSEG